MLILIGVMAMLKKITVLLIISLFLIGCYEGYTGADGEILLQYVDVDALKELTENPDDDIWIVDVRPKDSFDNGHIPTAKSFPSDEILDRLDELPEDKYLILYCETGGRAQYVFTKVLEEEGYTRIMNWGGYVRWNRAFN